jgi:hypothetical protein
MANAASNGKRHSMNDHRALDCNEDPAEEFVYRTINLLIAIGAVNGQKRSPPTASASTAMA